LQNEHDKQRFGEALGDFSLAAVNGGAVGGGGDPLHQIGEDGRVFGRGGMTGGFGQFGALEGRHHGQPSPAAIFARHAKTRNAVIESRRRRLEFWRGARICYGEAAIHRGGIRLGRQIGFVAPGDR